MQFLPYFYKAHSGSYNTQSLCDNDENIKDNWKGLVGQKVIPITQPDEWWHISIKPNDGGWQLHAENTHNLQPVFGGNEKTIHVASFLGPFDMSKILTAKMSELYAIDSIYDKDSHKHIRALINDDSFHQHWWWSKCSIMKYVSQRNKIQLICEGVIEDTIAILTNEDIDFTGIQYDFEYNYITN
jgi:hypothetical protein